MDQHRTRRNENGRTEKQMVEKNGENQRRGRRDKECN